jgi:hypothetical protein
VRFRILLLIAGFIITISYSCREKGGKYISQGEIHYSIEYTGYSNSVPKELLPKNLVVSFKDNKILFEIVAPIGNSGIVNLVNPQLNLCDTYISFFGARHMYASKPGELHPGFAAMTGMELRKTNKTAVICGYNCYNAEITFPSDRNKKFQIWYTNEIKVKDSNSSTPFHEINGVLMSFFFFMGRAEMRFEAEAVYKKDVPDKLFERRPKFRPISKENMENLIADMINF